MSAATTLTRMPPEQNVAVATSEKERTAPQSKGRDLNPSMINESWRQDTEIVSCDASRPMTTKQTEGGIAVYKVYQLT